uniref:Chemokine interleukin-8-like domain-containing protein n=1 Tax=Oncorhynchus tshawytscha TaxID=74940 RepID=A0A8C8I6V3_ONCTS
GESKIAFCFVLGNCLQETDRLSFYTDGNVPSECCFQSDCTHKGVMLITQKNYSICANPDEPLIDRIMKAIDENKMRKIPATVCEP